MLFRQQLFNRVQFLQKYWSILACVCVKCSCREVQYVVQQSGKVICFRRTSIDCVCVCVLSHKTECSNDERVVFQPSYLPKECSTRTCGGELRYYNRQQSSSKSCCLQYQQVYRFNSDTQKREQLNVFDVRQLSKCVCTSQETVCLNDERVATTQYIECYPRTDGELRYCHYSA